MSENKKFNEKSFECSFFFFHGKQMKNLLIKKLTNDLLIVHINDISKIAFASYFLFYSFFPAM